MKRNRKEQKYAEQSKRKILMTPAEQKYAEQSRAKLSRAQSEQEYAERSRKKLCRTMVEQEYAKQSQAKVHKARTEAKIREKLRLHGGKTDKEIQYEVSKAWKGRNQAKRLYYSARARAREKEIEFSITLDDIEIPEVCPLLGIPITNVWGEGKFWSDHNASLDRIDNRLGYVPGNVWVISWMANRMKTNATREQLITFARGILLLFEEA